MRNHVQKLAELKNKLAEYEERRDQILATGQTWKLRNGEDTREVSNVSLAQLNALISDTERKIAQLEGIVSGSTVGGIRVKGAVL